MRVIGRLRSSAWPLAVALIILAVAPGCARPVPTDSPLATIETEHLTADLYTKRTELAKRRVDFLEIALPNVEAALGVTVEVRPVICIYDGNNYPFRQYSWEVGRANTGMTAAELCLSLDPRGTTLSEEGLCQVAVHEYVHFLVDLRARGSGNAGVPAWFNEGVALYMADQQTSPLSRDRVRPVAELSYDSDPGALYSQSALMARVIASDFGVGKLAATIDACARGEADGVKVACGISEGELVERVRASLGK